MDPEQIARYKQEYYEAFAGDETLHELLNQHGGLVLARSGSHPPWPARISEAGEFAKMSRHRQKKGQICVYFFGTRNYGWVYRNAIMPFSDDYSALKASKKYSPHMIQRAIDALQEARVILDDTDGHNRRFYDRIMERVAEPVDMPCEICNRVDDHFSMLILCDGKDCKREFHMNCLSPPLEYVPPGDWYCPDCAKDPSKQHVWEGSQEEDSYVAEENVTDSAKKLKKDKLKVKEGSLKRKLPAAQREKVKSEADVSPANVKKQKAQRMKAEVSSPSNSRPSTPVQNTKKSMELSMLMNAADDDYEQQNRQSEERCLICGYGGELVVCEFYGCTKVYHQFCLGSFPFPKDEDATWFCPRHVCAISGASEYIEESDGYAKSPRKWFVKDQLWKCANCPLAIADHALPPIPKSYVLSRSNRSFTCMHCSSAAPVKVALAKKIERIWSMIANNNQGMAFCGPLLPGVELPKGRKEGSRLFLFRVLAKIRRLEYDDSASFGRDIDLVVREALDIINNRSVPLVEAATTLRTICNEQMKIHRAKLDSLDSKISGLKALSKSKKALEEAFVSAANGDKRRWPLKWREECGPFEDRFYPRVEPRSLAEWTAFITSAGVYASCDELDDSGGYDDGEYQHEAQDRGGFVSSNGARVHRRPDESSDWDSGEELDNEREPRTPRFPGLSLSEGTDVIMALAELSGNAGGSSKRFGAWPEEELDEINGQDFFLSPSVSEMQQMFDQQSAVLRRALESHTALQKAWLVNKQKLLGLGEGAGFSVGEGRLAAELRLANKNLRARLRNKDKLVDQLTSEQSKLRAEVLALQNQLQEAKGRASTQERGAKADDDYTGSDGGEDSADSADTDRKSPRNPTKSKAAAKAKLGGKGPQKPPKKTSGASGRPS